MSATLDIVKEKYPGRATLTPEDVAVVIHGNADRSTVQGVRDQLAAGLIVPGLRKLGGRWIVPVGPLVEALDGLSQPDISASSSVLPARRTVVINSIHPTKRRGRVPDAVRLGKIRAWGAEVLQALDEIERVEKNAAAGHYAAELGKLIPPAERRLKPIRITDD